MSGRKTRDSKPETRNPKLGTLYGIGVGPGDPELLTLKGLRLLREVPVVYVPVSRPGGESYGGGIVAEHIDRSRQRVEELVFAMRADREAVEAQWLRNARIIGDTLAQGSDAAFVTEGDPMLYSTFLHVAGALARELPEAPIVVVPGVSSVFAAAAAARVPLADGDERVAILAASYEQEGLRQALEAFDTVVLLKVASAIDRVLGVLEEMGLADRAVFVSRCGRPEEAIIRDVRSLRGQQLDYLSTLIVRRKP